MIGAVLVVFGFSAAAILIAWWYFRLYAFPRPPLGVFNLNDVAVLAVGIVALPYVYLVLPIALVAGAFGLAVLNVLALTVEPVLRARRAIWLAVLVVALAELSAYLLRDTARWPMFFVNDLVLVVAVAAVANLWVQSGMKARDAAILGGLLTVYDFIATARLPLTIDLIGRLATIPFGPVLAWPVGQSGRWLGLGLGDLLFASLFPLVVRKAFGGAAGLAALLLSLGALGVLLVLPAVGAIQTAFPVMVVLGPLMIVQYAFWRRHRRGERTMLEYLQAEPRPSLAARRG